MCRSEWRKRTGSQPQSRDWGIGEIPKKQTMEINHPSIPKDTTLKNCGRTNGTEMHGTFGPQEGFSEHCREQ